MGEYTDGQICVCFWCNRTGRRAFVQDASGVWYCRYEQACLVRQAKGTVDGWLAELEKDLEHEH